MSDDHTAADSAFSGRVGWVHIELDPAAEDPGISLEHRLRVAMARQ